MRHRDPVDQQLRRLGRQGAHMAGLAHVCAFALLILFSLGSLAALSGSALGQLQAEWVRGQVDVPQAINVAVSGLLVVCMDVAALYAASMLRMLAARGASAAERRLHQGVLVVACALEAATYAYMGALYDHPASFAAWALIMARAAAAPGFAVYLSLARALPVGPRDILHGVELAAGAGVLRDTVAIAADPRAPLADKAAIFNASAVMSPSDRARLADLLAVVTPTAAPALPAPDRAPERPHAQPPERPPTGPGSPAAQVPDASKRGGPGQSRRERERAIRLLDPDRGERPRVRTASAEARARRILARQPAISVRALAKAGRMSEATASKYKRLWASEHGTAGQVAQ